MEHPTAIMVYPCVAMEHPQAVMDDPAGIMGHPDDDGAGPFTL
jgi:hypothetical protein